ncbi:HDOD domain-containing protein [Rhodoferax sp. TBRC 17198]|jgi:HD-like signal output (HDOD) protein|uniref:HDOD domain-containing protein n=1 Tax=Rhodoferax potami TaxID=3068338 RepID=A0ABU3KJ51_9BURK|nr:MULTISPECIES: HDOD domain-containing protein [unclassified Rhodoferax]MDT7517628.1 HDOD domain-containing protein [Rhodoferax sp. TBRC 17660]MDT7521573.1 HDOD domain-containing protein [Rhodoferax sp. TBRC 17198]
MRVADIDREIETARAEGPLKDIVIQPCPALLSDLRVEVNREDPEPATIARIASRDVAMAAALIKVANSPIYARSRPAATVAEAVALLGISQTVSILTGFLLRETIQVKSPLLEHFWETSTRRAYAMGYIARQMYGVNADIAHTCGLFCNVGIPVMLQGIKGYEATLSHALAQTDKTVTEVENEAHRTDHAVVGAIVAKTWRLSPDVAHAVRLHHDFTVLKDHNIPAKVRTLVAMALLAEHLVALHEGVQQHREWDLHGAECLAHLHVSEEEIEHWQDALHEQFTGPAGF